MKVIIAGSRTIDDYEFVRQAVRDSEFDVTEVVSGGAPGVDRMGERWAQENDKPIRMFLARWKVLGRRAGIERNKEMAKYADALVAIWDGESRGTNHMIETMKAAGKPVWVFRIG